MEGIPTWSTWRTVMAYDRAAHCFRLMPVDACWVRNRNGEEVKTLEIVFHPYNLGHIIRAKLPKRLAEDGYEWRDVDYSLEVRPDKTAASFLDKGQPNAAR